jgi:polysaccharide export outer membrane protein
MTKYVGWTKRLRGRRAVWASVAAGALLIGVSLRAGADLYRLAPGDVIDVIVAGEPELSSDPNGILVGPDGRIGVPEVEGSLEVAGRTCDEVAEAIRKALDGTVLVHPRVMVRVQKHNQGVSVLGFVATQGRVPLLAEGSRLSQVLAAAGGVLSETGSLQRVLITRDTGEVIEANLDKVVSGDAQADVMVRPGDVVYVPHTEQLANVFGYVATPGRYAIQQGDRISDLIARAGGPLVGREGGAAEGDLSAVALMRADGATLTLDMTKALADRGSDASNPPAQAGDAVFVPEVRLDVSVLGHVVSPGRVQVRPGDRVSDALAAAGGPIRPTAVPAETIGADLAASVLYRARASREVVPLHLDRLYNDPKQFEDLPLVSGDVIIVPEGKNVIEVSGYVQKPGEYPFRAGETVRGALALAGGPLLNIGSGTTAMVRHADGSEEQINVERDDPKVLPGDAISVPYMRERVAVVGAVVAPGVFDWHEGDTLVSMLARAAGPRVPETAGMFKMERGNPSRVVLLRQEGETYKPITVAVSRFYKQGDPAGNPPLEPGDVIFVPTKGSFDFEALTRDLLVLYGVVRR